MSLIITVSGADFAAKAVGRSVQLTTDRDDLVGEYILGGSQAASVFNGADRNTPLTVAGTPVYAANYVTLATANYFDTNVGDNSDLSIMVIAEEKTNGFLVGQFMGTNATENTSMYVNSGGLPTTQSHSSDNTAQNAQLTATAPTTDFRAFTMRTTGSLAYTQRNSMYKGGALSKTADSTTTGKTRRVTNTYPFCIGSGRGSAIFPGPIKIAAVAIWHRFLSDADMLAAYLEARATMAARGITC